jgi:hypothetical protein
MPTKIGASTTPQNIQPALVVRRDARRRGNRHLLHGGAVLIHGRAQIRKNRFPTETPFTDVFNHVRELTRMAQRVGSLRAVLAIHWASLARA